MSRIYLRHEFRCEQLSFNEEILVSGTGFSISHVLRDKHTIIQGNRNVNVRASNRESASESEVVLNAHHHPPPTKVVCLAFGMLGSNSQTD